jgi:hypothetical protein
VPLRDTNNDDDFFKFYGDDRNFYIDQLDAVSTLKRVDIGAKDLVVYQNNNNEPYFSGKNYLDTVPKSQSISTAYEFRRDSAGLGNLNFAVKENGFTIPSSSIIDVFQNLTPGINSGKLKVSTTTTGDTKLMRLILNPLSLSSNRSDLTLRQTLCAYKN